MAAAKRYFKHVLDREKLTDRDIALLWVLIIHDFCEVRLEKMEGDEASLILWLAENAMNKLSDTSAKRWLFERIEKHKASVKPSPTLQNPLPSRGEGLGEG